MVEQDSGQDAPHTISADGGAAGSITRGFLFADLRGYTAFVEARGAAQAAELLLRYRDLVRAAVSRFAGAEIRTEGDSFHVVFSAVSAAVLCGLAIVDGARADAADHADAPIAVGVGVHAGETVETPDGFVGSPVNIAARLCASASQGQVLVSDTVRALTQTVLPVDFVPMGRKMLKGVSDPVVIFAVTSRAGVRPRPGRATLGRLSRSARISLSAAIVVGVFGVALLGWAALRRPGGLPAGTWKIGLDMPLAGVATFRGVPMRDAVAMAIDETNAAGGITGEQVALDAHDDATAASPQDPEAGAANATGMVADPGVVAMVGPNSSRVAMAQIPVTNEAGLLQCSPSASSPALTKPRDGALDLRSGSPDRINFIRTFPSDDIQGPALASFVLNDLGVSTALVIDDGDEGREIADQFSAAYEKLGGTTVRRVLNPGADPASVLGTLSDQSGAPRAVFFGGFTGTGAAAVRTAMAASGHGSVPFVSWDGIQDGSGADDGSFIASAGPAAAGSFFSHASIGAPKADFATRYRTTFGQEPDEYAAAAYACAEVILDSMQAIASSGPSADGLREAVRAYAVDPSHRFETVLGTVGFDANGDSRQQFVTFYKVDASAADGKGDWVIDKQQDYGPAP
jgi:branched-chain amino acid transport system substrate-binding protein